MMPSTNSHDMGMPTPLPESEQDTSTVALLYRQFGNVLIPTEAVRQAYFRNLNGDTFRRALRDGRIALPLVTLDDSAKAMPHVCIYHLAALIEHRSRTAAHERDPALPFTHQAGLNRALSDAVPITDFRPPASAE